MVDYRYYRHRPVELKCQRGLDRVRTVEDKGEEGTVISGDVMGSDPKTLFPLQTALGCSIAQNLFLSDKNLLVEGVADLAFLQTASEILRDAGRTGLREEVTITPVGGIGMVSAFASLFGANDLSLVVLHDFEGQDDQGLAYLVRSKLLPRRGVLHYAMFRDGDGSTKPADVEDLLNAGTYLRYFNEIYGDRLSSKAKVGDLPQGDRIVDRINRYLSSEGIRLRQSGGYNHYLPAKAFASAPPSSLTDAEPDRFERLFESVNHAFD